MAPVVLDKGTAPAWEESFPGVPHAVSMARQFVVNVCREVGFPPEVPELLVSELATNAVIHAGSRFSVRIYSSEAVPLRVEVEDHSLEVPLPRPGLDELAEGGRGLTLVEILSVERRTRVGNQGKTVSFIPRRVF